ncbi:Pectinesterase inhibitor domain [Dillenia turbinata]|uniref:Pectinesterase inhibitor domain n=1 Tax=Dillenia turbinata TaxID=194707 RepID=A0AAN8VXT5_9MAGN
MINPSNIWKALRLLGIWQAGNRIAVIIASNCYVDGDPRIANLKGCRTTGLWAPPSPFWSAQKQRAHVQHFLCLRESSSVVTQGGDPVADMCSKTPYPDLCTSIGKAAGIKEADAREIGLAVHGKANPMAVETSNFIKQLLKQKQDPPVLNSLKYCNDLYDTMVIRWVLSGPDCREILNLLNNMQIVVPPKSTTVKAGNRIAVIIASNCYVDGDPRIANLKGCRTTGLWAPPSPFWSAQKQRAHVQHFLCLRESSSVVTQGGDPVADMCSKTPYPDLCTSIGKAAGIKEADAREIGLAVHGKANPMAVETSNFIKQLLKQKQDPPVLNSLKYCNDLYDTMVILMGSIRAGLSGNPKFAEQYANSCATEADYCEGDFPPSKSPLTDKNKAIHDHCAVMAALAGNRIAVIIASNCYVDGDPRIANLKGCRTTGLWAPPSPFWSAQKQRAHVQHFLCLRESSSVVTQGGDPVADMCSKTPYPDLCTSIGKAAGIKEADAREIGLAVHGKANPMAVETSNFIKQLLKQKQDPPVLNSLKYCNDLYDTMVILMGSIRAGLSGNPKFAEQYANSCATEADYCEGDFPPSKSPLTDKNKAIHDHCAVMAALARMLL